MSSRLTQHPMYCERSADYVRLPSVQQAEERANHLILMSLTRVRTVTNSSLCGTLRHKRSSEDIVISMAPTANWTTKNSQDWPQVICFVSRISSSAITFRIQSSWDGRLFRSNIRMFGSILKVFSPLITYGMDSVL